jgi:C_GCAxxG_C_C family probable redox protein
MRLEQEAKMYFDQHLNCAQSTFAPFAKRLGLDPDTALKIATPFGGGMGHSGQVCGAVSGALMAIGLARGIAVYDQEKKYACYHLAETFLKQFSERHGDITCPGLLKLDIGDPDDLAKAREADLFHTICPAFVGDAAALAAEILEMD